MEENKIILTSEDGEEIECTILEETKLGETNYILVVTDEEEAVILKDVSEPDDEEAVYETIEDEEEYDSIADIFNELIEDIELI